MVLIKLIITTGDKQKFKKKKKKEKKKKINPKETAEGFKI